MADEICFACITSHGCIVSVGRTRQDAIKKAIGKGQRRGTTTVESTVVTVRARGRWVFECDKCRASLRP